MRGIFSWHSIAIIVAAVLLAKWTWVFLAPKDAALPSTSAWKKTADAEHLFGDVPAASLNQANSLGNIQLVGVFAHPTQGFAVLSVDGKQVGVGLGEAFSAGTKLTETYATYVIIERAGVKTRVDLPASKIASGISNATSQKSNLPVSAATMPQLNQIPAEQRAAMQQELDHFRRSH